MQGEKASVIAFARHFPANADDGFDARSQVVCNIAVMRIMIRVRHQKFDILT